MKAMPDKASNRRDWRHSRGTARSAKMTAPKARYEQGGAACPGCTNNVWVLHSVISDDCGNERVEIGSTTGAPPANVPGASMALIQRQDIDVLSSAGPRGAMDL